MIALPKDLSPFDDGSKEVVPTKLQPMDEWLREHFRDRNGSKFRESQVPWITAPGGPCDAVDNPRFNELYFQWASRMFKTNFAQAFIARQAHQSPCEMMCASRNQGLLKQVIGRFYQVLDRMPALAHELQSESKRSMTKIRFDRCDLLGAWAGSKSGLADESIPIGHGNEIDKWDYSMETATEGDPLPRFLKRGAEHPDRKFVLESTPGKRGISRVERGRLTGTNHQLQVPCPHCFRFQRLVFGNGKGDFGIFWDKKEDKTTDLDLARATAHYICANPKCGKRIDDEHRFWMMQRCVWVPEGCTVRHDNAMRVREDKRFKGKYLKGKQTRNGNIYSSQLPVWYGLFHGWGDMAFDFLRRHKREEERRQWVTEDAAETWEVSRKTKRWQVLYEEMVDRSLPRLIVPSWASVMTSAVDRQEDYYVWLVLAWGPGRRHHNVCYGQADDLEMIYDEVLSREYDYEDSTHEEPLGLRIGCTFIDNSHRPDSAVEQFAVDCFQNRGLQVWTCEGAETQLDFDVEERRKQKRAKTPGLLYYAIDGSRTQEWMERVLHKLKRGDPGSATIHAGLQIEHQDLLQQMLNETTDTSFKVTGHTRERWVRTNRNIPNDYRDDWRYAYAAMQVLTRNAEIRPRGQPARVRRSVVHSQTRYSTEW